MTGQRRLMDALMGYARQGVNDFRGVDPATGEADYWGRGGLAGMLGMPSAMESLSGAALPPPAATPRERLMAVGRSPEAMDFALGFAGSTTPKVGKLLDWSDIPLARVQTSLAKKLGATKTGEGKAYTEGGRRAYGEGGNKSRYYRLPDGREVRISDHADVSGSPAHIDVVIDPEYGQATISHLKSGQSARDRAVEWLNRDDAAISTNIHGEPIAGESVFAGDGAAWTEALLRRLRELGNAK